MAICELDSVDPAADLALSVAIVHCKDRYHVSVAHQDVHRVVNDAGEETDVFGDESVDNPTPLAMTAFLRFRDTRGVDSDAVPPGVLHGTSLKL